MEPGTSGIARRFCRTAWAIPSRTARTSRSTGQINFVNLYNKIKYLKKINDKGKGASPTPGKKTDKEGSTARPTRAGPAR
jgi:hypothetical protein